MADTDINAAALTVTITESLAVGHDNGSTNALDFAQTYTHTFASIINTSKRIIKLANTNLTEVATFGSTTADGAFVRADVRYIRVDNESTKEMGETVFYKVPILDDFYKKLVWVRPTKYRNCKIMPLGYSKKIINKD